MLTINYDDIKFLFYIIDTLTKRIRMDDKLQYRDLKSDIKKHILDELESLTRNPNTNDYLRIKYLSESYNYLKEE